MGSDQALSCLLQAPGLSSGLGHAEDLPSWVSSRLLSFTHKILALNIKSLGDISLNAAPSRVVTASFLPCDLPSCSNITLVISSKITIFQSSTVVIQLLPQQLWLLHLPAILWPKQGQKKTLNFAAGSRKLLSSHQHLGNLPYLV